MAKAKTKAKSRKKQNPRKKRVYYDENRTLLWKGWRKIFLAGTELENLPLVYGRNWDFDHLEDDLESKTDFGDAKFVYLFGGTEAHSLGTEIVLVPYVVAVVGDISAPDQLGIKSVQKVEESFVPMKNFRMSWVLFDDDISRASKRKGLEMYYLTCSKRRQTMKHMKEEDMAEFNYVMPYLPSPQVVLKDEPAPTTINKRIDVASKTIQLDYDWDLDDLKTYVESVCEEYGIDFGEHGRTLRDIILEAKKDVLQSHQMEEEKKKSKFLSLDPKTQEKLKKVRFIKYYPQNEEKLLPFMNPYINRYYGKAHQVKGGIQ